MNELQKSKYINRELSWLQFNGRVLQEAADETVPLIERLRFLGIFSNNLDEFFKVRYATVRRIVRAGRKGRKALGVYTAEELLPMITDIVIDQQAESLHILQDIYKKLEAEGIHVIKETEIEHEEHERFVKDFFTEEVSPAIETIILREDVELPRIQDLDAYLTIKMVMKGEEAPMYALLEIPSSIDRFIVLPKIDDHDRIIMIDDVIRYNLDSIFNIFDYESISAHMIKITRDAELDIESDLKETLDFLLNKLDIENDDSIIPGGRYHNRKDYMGFPSLGRKDLLYPKQKPLPIKGITLDCSMFEKIAQKDYLQYAPYHTFAYTIKFLREAALDPKVKSVKITIYRLAKISHIASALINAAQNGKEVTVQIELRARFDEESNMMYAKQMENQGVKLIFGVPGLKVHSKVCVIEREEQEKIVRYGFISTGNFNHKTANIYTDYTLFTADQKILKDLSKLFVFFDTNYIVNKYKHLVVSPHYSRNTFYRLIDEEIEKVEEGGKGYIRLKLNSLSNYAIIGKLYEASQAGVKVDLIVRGICCLIPGVPGLSDNIRGISVIDRFLEHPRVYVFGKGDESKVYISSSDWMSWKDNVKARKLNERQDNAYVENDQPKVRSQFATYEYYLKAMND